MTEYTEALHKLAEFIDEHSDLFGTHYGINHIAINGAGDLGIHSPTFWGDVDGAEEKANMRAIIRALGGTFDKEFSGSNLYLRRKGFLGFFNVVIYANREGVCERKVVGTKTVEHARVAAVPAFTETVEEVEWECGTLLGEHAVADERELALA